MLDNNMNDDRNGNPTLQAEAVSGVAPYGLNRLEAAASVSGLLPRNLFDL